MKIDYTGQKIGRLSVLRYIGIEKRNRTFECRCDCGTVVHASAAALKAGRQSCGCLQKERAGQSLEILHAKQVVHGYSGTITYNSWAAMMSRCFDYKKEIFDRYGGIGITACAFLAASPANLVAAIGERPDRKFTLDRINVKGNYSCGTCPHCRQNNWPANVRWATMTQQCCNRKNNVLIKINGKTQTRSQWAVELGIPYKKAISQLRKYEVKTKPFKFTPPQGCVPEGKSAGDTFDAVCTFRVEQNGEVCLTMLGDCDMGYDERPKMEHKQDYGGYAKSMQDMVGKEQT